LLSQVSASDLYQQAIIGTYKAVLTVREYQEAKVIPLRVKAYIRSEIKRTYFAYFKKHIFPGDVLEDLSKRSEESFDGVDNFDTIDELVSIINKMQLSSTELLLLRLRIMEAKTYKDISKYIGKSVSATRMRFKRLLIKIKLFLEEEELDV